MTCCAESMYAYLTNLLNFLPQTRRGCKGPTAYRMDEQWKGWWWTDSVRVIDHFRIRAVPPAFGYLHKSIN